MAIQPGTDIERYHIIEQLGEGGMAVVYKAYDTQLEREVAIKVLRFNQIRSDVSIKRFRLDAKILAKFNHQNIIKILDYGEFEDIPYLVMDYIPGGTLKQLTGNPIPWKEAAKMIIPIAEALGYAHKQDVIHRDVKPSNILLDEEGRLLLTDFGIAKILETTETIDLTKSGFGIGTPEYMPPEVFEDQSLDGRADIYSLGIVFYELITGRTPFKADTPLAILKKHAFEPLPRPSNYVLELPASVEKFLYKALAKKPEDRFQDMDQFAQSLQKIVEEPDSGLPKNHETSIIKIFISIAIVLFLIAFLLFRKPTDKKSEETLTSGILSAITESAQMVQTSEPTEGLANEETLVPTAEKINVNSLGVGSTKTSESDGMSMVFVPEGEFLMGAVSSDSYAYDDEKPQHSVYLDAFWIDQTEVTNGMYERCVNAGVCLSQKKFSHNPSTGSYHFGDSSYSNYPAVYINWKDASTYCQWVGKRLPTEAEWEKAAKGVNENRYPWGNASPDSTLVNCDGRVGDTVEVGSYPAGASYYGALDMAGNVYEWVSDWYDERYYSASDYENPQGPANGITHGLRGGSFFAELKYIRTTYRERPASNKTENYGSGNWGFRCVMDVQ